MLVGTDPGDQFCQEFGYDDPTFEYCPPSVAPPLSMRFGHYQDPNLDVDGCGNRRCIGVPSLPSGHVELLFCIGWTEYHWVIWSGQLVNPNDKYKVEVKSFFNNYVPFYQGTGTSSTYTTGAMGAYFRVKIVSIGGDTGWVYFGTTESCVNGPPDP